MSATNRGSKRVESDFYATPEETIRRFLSNYKKLSYKKILEPCAGDGAINRNHYVA